ncbi:MAG: alpha/beta hydrolase [Proteobacteria bacterium]|nr:alpha/beta hydrolase [Pseudomonadota bacterium]
MKTVRLDYMMMLMAVLVLSGCASQPKNQIMLMPAPDVFDQGEWDPFTDRNPIKDIPYGGILYATDREPASGEEGYYLDDRGHVLRLGVAKVTVGKEGTTWEDARRISLLKERPEDYPLKVTDVQEIGILDSSINVLTESLVDIDQRQLPGEQFAAKVNAKLAISRVKDAFIYLHGYKVVFENPLLVASELWHFLGYEGAFIAFSWPSTPSTLAYFSDLETAALSSGNLRIFIQYLAEKTDARRIHIIGYSAGTRVVAQALNQLALMHVEPDGSVSAKNLRIGNVILTGSDLDLHLFGSYLVDGVLDIVDNLTVYASAKDKALGMSRWVFGRDRLGQIVSIELSEAATTFLRQNDNLVIVNATDSPGADTGNGHAYFRQSPWTSSDILATLIFDFKPGERGLERVNLGPIWTFSADYIDRLREALVKARSN